MKAGEIRAIVLAMAAVGFVVAVVVVAQPREAPKLQEPTFIGDQADRDYAYDMCSRDSANFDGPLCTKIKNGEVPIPLKYAPPGLSSGE